MAFRSPILDGRGMADHSLWSPSDGLVWGAAACDQGCVPPASFFFSGFPRSEVLNEFGEMGFGFGPLGRLGRQRGHSSAYGGGGDVPVEGPYQWVSS